jgi:malate dehydrogenase (oxaloacetate-decarboxylating)(NADP+)
MLSKVLHHNKKDDHKTITEPHSNNNKHALIHYTSSGHEIVSERTTNKFTAFTSEERNKLGLRGLIPPTIENIQQQMDRELRLIRAKNTPLEKYMALQSLHDRNIVLFYRLVSSHVEEMMPLVYTPVVGEACIRWSEITTHPRGLTITIGDIGHVDEILANWPSQEVRAIVVTDGERILGLGDQGGNGMGIPVGKLQLYTVCAGIPPHMCLPVTLDVGTNTESIRNDPLYLGVRAPRDRSPKYTNLVHEFMTSVQKRFGSHCLVQFEDFGNTTAFVHLQKYRNDFLCFNDDIQGTAAVSLAGVYSSLRLTSQVPRGAKSLADHTYVFLGAGEAGVGIAELIAEAIANEEKMSVNDARKKIWLVDSTGLVSSSRTDKLAHHKLPFAHDTTASLKASLGDNAKGDGKLGDHSSLVNIVKGTSATVLIGVSAQPQTFTKEVIEAMGKNAERPVIFALSNPTSKCECTAEQCYTYCNKAIFASGSPFAPVKIGEQEFKPAQANNAYIFPALALGCLVSKARIIPDELLHVTARSLALQTSETDLAQGSLFPSLSDIQKISLKIATDVAQQAYNMKIAQALPEPKDIGSEVKAFMYEPVYEAIGNGKN